MQYKNTYLKFRKLQFSITPFHVLHVYHNIHHSSSAFFYVLVTQYTENRCAIGTSLVRFL